MSDVIDQVLPLHLLEDSSDASWRIGLPIDTAAHGAELIVAAHLAIARHRRVGGPPVQAMWCDDRRCAEGGVEAARQLMRAGLRYVVGHFSSSAAVAAAPVYAAHDALLIAPGASSPELTAPRRGSVLRLFGRDDGQADAIVEMLQHQGASEVEMLAQDIRYGQSMSGLLATRLQGAKIRCRASVIGAEEASPINAARPTPVVLAGTHEFAARLLPQISTVRCRVVTDDALTPAFLRAVGVAAEGVLVPVIGGDESDAARALTDDYQRLRGEPPGAYFLTSFVAVSLILDALRRFGDCGGRHLAACLRSRPWRTPLGVLQFDAAGEVQGLSWQMVRVSEGRFVATREAVGVASHG